MKKEIDQLVEKLEDFVWQMIENAFDAKSDVYGLASQSSVELKNKLKEDLKIAFNQLRGIR